jgi:hypothetical protein
MDVRKEADVDGTEPENAEKRTEVTERLALWTKDTYIDQ